MKVKPQKDGEKILFISTWFPPMSGGPKNLFNHLIYLEADSYRILASYFNFSWSEIDPKTWLPVPYAFYDYKGEVDRGQKKFTVEASRVRYRNLDRALNVIRRRIGHRRKGQLLCDFIDNINRIVKVFLAGRGLIKKEKIGIIVTVSDMGWALIGGYLLSLFTRKPLVIYLFDLYADNYLLPINKIFAKIFEPWMIGRARLLLVTNEETAKFYESKYGSRCPPTQVVRNSSDSSVRDFNGLPYKKSKPFRIVFAGHIYWPHEEAMENLYQALQKLKDLPLRLDLYVLNTTPEFIGKWSSLGNVQFFKVTHLEIAAALQSANLLFLPFSWNSQSPAIIQTASPAKLTDYLASGTPVLAHAPEWSFVAKLIKEHDCGFVATENSSEKLAEHIRKIVTSTPEKILELKGKKAAQVFKDLFSLESNAQLLIRGISRAQEPPATA